MTSYEDVCFVISPIGADGSPDRKQADELLEFIIDPVAGEHSLRVVRADTIHNMGNISNQIIEHLIQSKIVVADMSSYNPNVFYELAVRHALRKPVVHMIRSGQTIPFDVAPQRAIFYELDLPGAKAAKESLGRFMDTIDDVLVDDTPLSSAMDRIAVSTTGTSDQQRESRLLEILQDVQVRLINLPSQINSDIHPRQLPLRAADGLLDLFDFLESELSNINDRALIAELMSSVLELLDHAGTSIPISQLRHPSRSQRVNRLIEALSLENVMGESIAIIREE